ncbi:hypothetical protein [Brachyspira pulli]|uniref:hypothetical protein n=1 Tax=Brachyspira pulli TaxID=310721 RepID=UPI003006B17C
MKKSNILACIISFVVTLIALLIMNYFNNSDPNTSLSTINIMNINYKDLRDYALDGYYIDGYKEKEQKVKELFKSKYITSRLKYRASLISHLGEEEIVINGIDIKNDEEVFNVLKDSTLDNFDANNSIVISKSIASVLDVNTNDTIILKAITKTGHYNAEEYTIIEVSEKLDYNYALIDIDNLNSFVGLEDCATEMYIKQNISEEDLLFYDNDIKNIFGDDFRIYSKEDIIGENYNANKNNKKIQIYIILTYLFVLFSIYMFINSYSISNYKQLIKGKLLFSFIGFLISFVIDILITKFLLKLEVTFNFLYIIILIINLLTVILANIKYSILEWMFIEGEEEELKSIRNKNIFMMCGIIFTYVVITLVLYSSFFGFINKEANNDNVENIVRIVKNNTSENTFLFNGSLSSSNDNLINILYKDIESYDQYADVERVLTFPVGVVIRTGSIGSRVYTYEKNILENGMVVSNVIVEGEMFETPKKEILIGKDLAAYLNIKVGDALSLIAKASRGWLETSYFYVSGIYDFKDKNYDIIGDITSMSNFIYLKEGDKSPYNESILVFSDNKDIYSYLNNSSFVENYNLNIINFNEEYYTNYNYSLKNIIFVFIVILALSLALLVSSLLSIFYRRLLKFSHVSDRKLVNSSFIICLLTSIIISAILIVIFWPFIFSFLLFVMIIVALSSVLSVLITNCNTE